MMRRYVVSAAVLAFLVMLFGSAQIIKLNSIHGLFKSFFSFSHCVSPLIGMVFGMWGSCMLIFGMFSLKMTGFAAYSYFGLPTFAASLCWATRNSLVRIGVPAVCMALFIAHPIGYAAAPYAFYWIIPMVCAFASKNRFLTALSSTFIAHGVGSVIHLYFINPMTSSAWLALIPVVAIERLVLALGMYVAYGAVTWALHLASLALQQKFQQCPAATD